MFYLIVPFLREQIKEENVDKSENGAKTFKLSERFLGLFTHCVVYEQDADGIIRLVFKIAFDNYSRSLFFDEAGIIVDTVCKFFGWPSKEDYEIARKRIAAGDTATLLKWEGEDVVFTLKADPESHRPELYVKIAAQKKA